MCVRYDYLIHSICMFIIIIDIIIIIVIIIIIYNPSIGPVRAARICTTADPGSRNLRAALWSGESHL